jgi:transposase-like protein
MPAPRKYDKETQERAIRMYRDRLRENPGESKLAARKHVSRLLDIKQPTLRNWIEREDVDAGERPGVSSETAAQLAALRKENAELRRANEILKTASAFFAAAELDRRFK